MGVPKWTKGILQARYQKAEDDVAERLGTTPGDVRAMRARGQLPPCLKLGKRVRWCERDLDEWINALPTSEG